MTDNPDDVDFGRDVFPSFGRLSAATGGAALAAALSAAAMSGPWGPLVFLFALMIAAAHAVVIAVPAYLVLQKYTPATFSNAALAGFLIGAVPVGILVLLMGVGGGPRSLEPMIVSPVFGAFGAIGGLAFRAVLGRDPQRQ